mmetsp:Transcript_58960/g.171065  ORF Transcript_58960/g.171065 Transcript_58960/m.171065 type:complete len:204 (+) Transcript_58960:38-649(+)
MSTSGVAANAALSPCAPAARARSWTALSGTSVAGRNNLTVEAPSAVSAQPSPMGSPCALPKLTRYDVTPPSTAPAAGSTDTFPDMTPTLGWTSWNVTAAGLKAGDGGMDSVWSSSFTQRPSPSNSFSPKAEMTSSPSAGGAVASTWKAATSPSCTIRRVQPPAVTLPSDCHMISPGPSASSSLRGSMVSFSPLSTWPATVIVS